MVTQLPVVPGESHRELVPLSQARQRLAEAQSFSDITAVRDQAEMIRSCAKTARLGLEVLNEAAEIKIRAERKAGEILGELKLRGGDRKSNSHDVTLKLDDLDITRHQSSRWQQEALVPEKQFEQFTRYANDHGEEISSAAFLRFAKKQNTSWSARPSRTPGKSNPGATSQPLSAAATPLVSSPEAIGRIKELRSYLLTLSSLLEGISTGEIMKFNRGERRGILRYLAGSLSLVDELLAGVP